MRYRLLLTFSILAMPGIASAAVPSPRESGDLVLQARAILKKYCSECHGTKTGTFDVLDYSQITEKNRPVPFVNPTRSQIIEFLEDGSMPPGGRPRPDVGEIAILKKWMAEKAPRFFKEYDDPTVLQAVFEDWEKQESPKNVRYVSLAHRVDNGSGIKSLQAEQLRLQEALDAATTKDRAFALQPVDDAATIFRIDLEKLGWADKGYFYEMSPNQTPSEHDLIPFDLISLENPYLVEQQARFEKFLAKPKYGPLTPFLRGDWLADALAPGSPLAADMKSLVELRGPGERPCGPKIRAFQKSTSTSTAPVPLTSWYGPERHEPFKLEVTLKGAKPPFTVNEGDLLPFEVVSDVGVKFVLLLMISDGSVRIIEPGGGTILKAGEARMLQTKNQMPFKSAIGTEYFIIIAAPDFVPLPTLVRTEHNTIDCPKGSGQIWRMLFTNDTKFDPSKAVRKVVTVNVTRK